MGSFVLQSGLLVPEKDAAKLKEKAPLTARHFGEYTNLIYNRFLSDTDLAVRKKPTFYETLRQDGYISALLDTRAMAIVKAQLEIVAMSETDEYVADQIRRVWNAIPNKTSLMRWLFDAVLEGVSFIELVWEARAGEWWIIDVIRNSKDYFEWDADMKDGAANPYGWRYKGPDKQDIQGEGMMLKSTVARPANGLKFFVSAHGQHVNRPHGDPLGTRIYWYKYFSEAVIHYMMTFMEYFSNPWKIAHCENEEQVQAALSMFRAMKNAPDIAVPAGVQLEIKEVGAQAFMIFESILKYFKDQLAISIKGNTMTTQVSESGGAYSVGMVQERTEASLLEGDLASAQQNLNHGSMGGYLGLVQMIARVTNPERYVRKNTMPPRVEMRLSNKPAMSDRAFIEKVDKAKSWGVPVGKRYVRDRLDLPKMADSDDEIDAPKMNVAKEGTPGGVI